MAPVAPINANLNATSLQNLNNNSTTQFQDALSKADANKDGVITAQELKDFLEGGGGGPEKGGGGGGPEKGGGGGGPEKGGGGGGCGGGDKAGGGGGGSGGTDMMKLLDKNGDGKISEEEMKDFEKKYGNGDGVLTKDELNQGLQAAAQEQGIDTAQIDSQY